ncbi:helix-turn-helix domain-containing protein [Alistipes putredinis]|uniref:helix-turn-helix domain-containing protein n=1 Tax=Alistipes putredinis TaxID=28117 RepID=UPI003A83F8CF
MGAFHMAIYARQSKSRPHYLFTICLIWMALIELKEFFLSHDAAYNYEILGPGFTFPDLFTLALLSLFFFELVMPGRITARYGLKLLWPFILLGGAYWIGTAFEPRMIYSSLSELLHDLPDYLPTVLLLYILYTICFCIFAMVRVVMYSKRYAKEIAQAYSFTESIHLRWMRWMPVILGFYLLSYILIIAFTSDVRSTIVIYLLTLVVWGILYGCILQYRIPDIIRNYWQMPLEGEIMDESPETTLVEGSRIALLREQLQEAIVQRKLYLNPGLTIIDLACECGTNRTQLSLLLNKELGLSFRDYINHCRIQYAALPLLEDEEAGHKIEEVALLSGFGSTATFYRAFAKEKGMAPQQWQESIRKSRTRGGEDNGLREITGLQEEYP